MQQAPGKAPAGANGGQPPPKEEKQALVSSKEPFKEPNVPRKMCVHAGRRVGGRLLAGGPTLHRQPARCADAAAVPPAPALTPRPLQQAN